MKLHNSQIEANFPLDLFRRGSKETKTVLIKKNFQLTIFPITEKTRKAKTKIEWELQIFKLTKINMSSIMTWKMSELLSDQEEKKKSWKCLLYVKSLTLFKRKWRKFSRIRLMGLPWIMHSYFPVYHLLNSHHIHCISNKCIL